MSLSKAGTRLGLLAIVLGLIVTALIGSLIAADRAISAADREYLDIDARAVSLVIEREIRLRAESLIHVDPRAPVMRAPGSFEALWVVNRNGAVLAGSEDTASIGASLLDSLARTVTVSNSPLVRILPPSDDSRGSILLAAMVLDRSDTALVAVGRTSAQSILSVVADTTARRPWMALSAGSRQLATVGTRGPLQSDLSAHTQLPLLGDQLYVEITHPSTGRAFRVTLSMLAVAALIALIAALVRERRQADSLTERTLELERLYQEVARSNRMKSEFLANVSHELRTPLNAVVGFVEMLREGVYGELSPRQALPVDRIAASSTHLRQLVDRLLDIARIAAGRLEVHTEAIVLRPFVLNVASEMESLVSERGLALSIAVGATLPRIRSDQTHLRQILINLIGNAVKYTPTGSIQVRARIYANGATARESSDDGDVGAPPDPARSWVALQVADTGIGIAATDLERIFDEFEQVNAGARTDSARRGTGLGLAISRRLARLIGGELTVVSEVGRGSTFTVWLPVEVPERATPV